MLKYKKNIGHNVRKCIFLRERERERERQRETERERERVVTYQ